MAEIIFIILGLAIFIGGLIASSALTRKIEATNSSYDEDSMKIGRIVARVASGLGVLLAVIVGLSSMLYTQGVGEAKVIVNLDGTISHSDLDPGMGFKAPWQSSVDFDLFSQTLQFAGDGTGAPSYTGGTVSGFEITAAVARGAQSNFDLSITYSLDPEAVEDIYRQFRSQENFTSQVIVNKVLDEVRAVPAAYSPVDFRGEKRGEAGDRMLKGVQDALGTYGVKVAIINLQNITYSEEVEASIKNVEVTQQKEEQAAAELRAIEISAQGVIVEAEAQAEANRLLTQSLSPEVLTNLYIKAISEGKGTFVVPEGSTPFITVK